MKTGGGSLLALVGASFIASAAHGDTTTLRFATIAPDGTAWVREFRAFGREVEIATNNEVRIKWYFSGIAGDEAKVLERIGRDQLDGAIGSTRLCAGSAPSMRALTLGALFRDSEEAIFVMNRMKPIFDAEFAKAGLVNIAEAGMGFHVLLSRTPIRSLDDMRDNRFWVWDIDEVLTHQLPGLFHLIPLPVEHAARAYDAHQLDGFIGVPTAALAFQWSTQARYILPLRVSFLPGCMIIAARAFEQLPLEVQLKVRSAAAKLQVRVEDSARQQDAMLLGGLFARQGLQSLPLSDKLRAQFAEAARAAAAQADPLLPPGARRRVANFIDEYRALKLKSAGLH